MGLFFSRTWQGLLWALGRPQDDPAPAPAASAVDVGGLRAHASSNAEAIANEAIERARVSASSACEHPDDFYSVGDVVRLASGGPLMTITDFRQTVSGWLVVCAWFDGSKLREAALDGDALDSVRDGQPVRNGVVLAEHPEEFFGTGDKVRLASGGPALTVTHLRGPVGGTLVVCTWFNGSKLKTEAFDPQVLFDAESAS